MWMVVQLQAKSVRTVRASILWWGVVGGVGGDAHADVADGRRLTTRRRPPVVVVGGGVMVHGDAVF